MSKTKMTPNDRAVMTNHFRVFLQKNPLSRLRSIHDFPWYPSDVAQCIRIAAISMASDEIGLFDPQDGEIQFCHWSPTKYSSKRGSW